ncbi:MAG: YqaA family protein [Candidatus Euphemobacter frigidus]|nr:YqaA family protein [Candidatus Euphemobacter frigidus]MDP8276079.1 YqaA family protein [Candidatus Euphemobacter frigidus]
MKILRNLYDWVLHWANTPYGPLALFVLAFSESSFFPIPPDVLLIALILGNPRKAFRFALICSIASIVGGSFGYFIGYHLWWSSPGVYSALAEFFFNHIPGFTQLLFDTVRQKYELYSFWIVFTAGFTPIPYKVITISAGAFNINFPLFLIASTISRTARFFLVSVLLWKFGPPIKVFIDKYFNLLSIAFVVLLVLGFVVIKYFLH